MKKQFAYALLLICLSSYFVACSKENSSGQKTEITVASIAGTYKLTALTWKYNSITFNIYDSLEACDKDNLFIFKTDMTAITVDAGIVCDPPSDGTGNWELRGDSLFIDGSGAKIQSFDGKKLVLTGQPANETIPIEGVTTLTRQ